MKYRLEIISIAIAIILGISIFTYLNEQDTNNENKDIKQNNNDTIEDDNKTDDRLVSTWNETLIDLTDYIEPPIWIINDSYISGYDIIKNLNGEFMLVYASDRGNLFKLSRSNDGKTWSRNSTIICSSVWGQNPSIIQNRNGVFFIFINGLDHCWLIKSDDGFNWSSPLKTNLREDSTRINKIIRTFDDSFLAITENSIVIDYKWVYKNSIYISTDAINWNYSTSLDVKIEDILQLENDYFIITGYHENGTNFFAKFHIHSALDLKQKSFLRWSTDTDILKLDYNKYIIGCDYFKPIADVGEMYIVVYLSNNSIHWSIPLLINKDVKDPESIVLISNNINDIILTYESDDVIYIMNLNYSKLQELYNTSIE